MANPGALRHLRRTLARGRDKGELEDMSGWRARCGGVFARCRLVGRPSVPAAEQLQLASAHPGPSVVLTPLASTTAKGRRTCLDAPCTAEPLTPPRIQKGRSTRSTPRRGRRLAVVDAGLIQTYLRARTQVAEPHFGRGESLTFRCRSRSVVDAAHGTIDASAQKQGRGGVGTRRTCVYNQSKIRCRAACASHSRSRKIEKDSRVVSRRGTTAPCARGRATRLQKYRASWSRHQLSAEA